MSPVHSKLIKQLAKSLPATGAFINNFIVVSGYNQPFPSCFYFQSKIAIPLFACSSILFYFRY